MSKIRGGYYCLEDAARNMCAEIISISKADRGPHGEPVSEACRQQLAVEYLTERLRDLNAGGNVAGR